MNIQNITIAALAIVSLVIGAFIFRKRVPRRLKPAKFSSKWQELQKLCADKATWPEAIIKADTLLDEALKKRRFQGRSMGERLVSAQRFINDNDGVWYGHKLRKRIEQDKKIRLRKNDVKDALIGIKQALQDLGAFKNGK